MKSSNRISLRASALTLTLACLLAAFVMGCGLLDDSNDDGGAPTQAASTSTSVTVLEAVTSTQINEQQQATGLVSRVFPAGTTQVFAVVTLEGVAPGMEVLGRWYQLSVQNAPPEGAEVSAAGVTLTEENVAEGRARVALNLSGGSNRLPEGDWMVRIYADGDFIRTMAFVITQMAVVAPSPGAGQQPSGPTGAPTIEVAREYTVQSGDSLNSIAEEFKGDNETNEAFLTRLIALNALQPGSTLSVGQVLKIPAPQ